MPGRILLIIHHSNNIINQEDKEETEKLNEVDIPKCSDIYISTQTKIAYLNRPIDLNDGILENPRDTLSEMKI